MKIRRLLGAANRASLWRYLTALWLLMRDPRTPSAAKWVAGLVVAYALSPIDLIPDFIPVLGQLDDLLLLPLGIALAVRLVPPALWADMLARAEQHQGRLPRMLRGVLIVVGLWLLLALLFGAWMWWVVRAA